MNQKRKFNGILCVVMGIFGMNLTALAPLVAELDRISVADFNSGLLLSMHFIGFICVAILAGILADHIGKKPVIIAGLLGYALFFMLFTQSGDAILSKYVCMFCIGGCSGILESINSAYVSDNNFDNPDYYVNVSHTWFGVGGVLGPILLAAAITFVQDWRIYYYLLAVIAVVAAVVFCKTEFVSEGRSVSTGRHEKFCPTREIPFLLICLACFSYTGAEVASWSWLSDLLQKKSSFTVMQAAFAVSLFWVAVAVGRYLCGRMLTYLKTLQMILMLSAGASVTTLLMIVGTSVGAAYVLAVILGLACSSLFPFLSAYGAERTNLTSGTAFSTVMVCGNCGSAVIPYVVGVLNKGNLFSAAKILLAICFLLSAVLAVLAGREAENKEH